MSNKALVYPAKHASQFISTESFPIPTLAPGEVLIKIEYAGLNPVDWKIVKYGIFIETFPTVLGSDGSGIVVQVADDVSIPKIGDSVFFQGNYSSPKTCTFQQYAALPAPFVYRLPHNISFEQGATLAVSGISASVGLFEVLKITPPWVPDAIAANKDKTVLIWGGSTAAGHLAIQFANLAGVTVIVTASPQYHDSLKKLGAHHVIDYKASDVGEQIKALTNGKLTLAFDLVGASTQLIFNLLHPTESSSLALLNSDNVTGKEAFPNRHVLPVYGSSFMYASFAKSFWGYVSDILEKGLLIPQNFRVLGGLDAVVEGQAEQIAGKVSSVKLIVKP
ncbi:hypothetical protein HK100_002510 [Physocladia obscura]|uniref:Enoyl reductase (ER) domain-containing protein n=1 Tax=Physocladia obscura TaxID=109957 RepID=A0AAD5XDT4_9FUNG|nr:hypothetical protein HK100_002510 [Physocladia obscura]